MKHTPPPWYMGILMIDDYDDKSISIGPSEAECHYENSIATVHGDNNLPIEENAQIIIMAPQFFEAFSKLPLPPGGFTRRTPKALDVWFEEYNKAFSNIREIFAIKIEGEDNEKTQTSAEKI